MTAREIRAGGAVLRASAGDPEQELGAEHPDTASSLNNLAGLYRDQGNMRRRSRSTMRALAIREQQLGAEHPDTASSLNNLADSTRPGEVCRGRAVVCAGTGDPRAAR